MVGGSQDKGASAEADRAGGPSDLGRQGVSAKGAHPLREECVIANAMDGKWLLFDRATALGEFATWADAARLRGRIAKDVEQDSAPAWTPKSGGY
jgi:hypothetical protein